MKHFPVGRRPLDGSLRRRPRNQESNGLLVLTMKNPMILIACLVTALLAGCDRKTAAKVQTKEAALAVTVVPVRTQQVQRTVEFVATLDANDQVTVSSEIDGQIAAIAADMGDRVQQGQLLAKIRDTEFRFAVQQAEGSLKQTLATLGLEKLPPPGFDVTQTSLVLKARAEWDDAQNNLKRMKTLSDKQLISAQEYDAAETRYKTTSATYNNSIEQARALVADAFAKDGQLGTARKKLSDTVISAPLTGSISRRFVSPGEYVKAGTQLFSLVQDNPLKLRGMIPERFAPDVKTDQAIEARVDSFPDQIFKGKLTRISPASDTTSRSFMIEGLVANPDRRLKPGFFAHATILTVVDPNGLTVPQQALVTFAGLSKVFVVQDDVARERVVQTGVRVGSNEVEVSSGLKPGELIAISGLTRLTDGAPVKVSGPIMPQAKSEGGNEPR
jgi:RND family efflux transporter MFP subunit